MDQKYLMKQFEIFPLRMVKSFFLIIIFGSKVYKLQRNSSVTQNVQKSKNSNFSGDIENNLGQNPTFAFKKFLSDLVIKKLNVYVFESMF